MSAAPGCLIVRADASARIGMGHLMRCLALAQAWAELGGRTIFAMHETNPAADARRQMVGAGYHRLSSPMGSMPEAFETAALAEREKASWIVADSYEFTPGYQTALGSAGLRVLAVDDDGRYERYEADMVLNQNIYASQILYADRADRTRLLLGPAYALLREEFRASPRPARTIPVEAKKVLVTLGGADPANVTQMVIEALRCLPDQAVEAIVVVGGNNPHRAELERAAGPLGDRMRLVYDATNMPELMVWADVAISAAGSTTLELAFMGVPMLLVILAENQRGVAEGMAAAGAACNLGWADRLTNLEVADALRHWISSQDEREQLSRAAATLVDGRGAERVARTLLTASIQLRTATAEDAALLFEWANDPAVRAVSFQSESIAWADHRRWLDARLASSSAILLIAESDEGEPIGVARFEMDGDVATISISISDRFRGRGYGAQVIELASRSVLQRAEISTIRALVKSENDASVRAFLSAGYREETDIVKNGARSFLLMRSNR